MMAIVQIILVAKGLAKIKEQSDVGCTGRVCKRTREQRCAITKNLPWETYGPMKLRVVTHDKVSSMNTLWQEEEFEQICNRVSLTEKAAKIEKTISVKEHERERHDFDPKISYENWFWNQRPDGIVINKNHQTIYILEFKPDRDEDFLGVKEDEANEQYKASSRLRRSSKRLSKNGLLNTLVLWQGGITVVQQWKTISVTSSRGSIYKQERRTRFWWRMCNAYAKRMAQ